MAQTAAGESVQAGRSMKMLFAAAFLGILSAIFLIGFFGALYVIFYERSGILIPVAVSLLFGPGGLWLIATATIALRDFFRHEPILTADSRSICDRRLSQKAIALSDIEHAKVLYTRAGPVGLRLRLRTEHGIRSRSCRMGCWGMPMGFGSKEVCISTTLMNVNPKTLTVAIVDLIERAGCPVDRYSRYENTFRPNHDALAR